MAISTNIVVVGISDLLKVVDSRGDGYKVGYDSDDDAPTYC